MVNPWKNNHLFTCAHIPYPLLLKSHITKYVNFTPSPIQKVAFSNCNTCQLKVLQKVAMQILSISSCNHNFEFLL